jgi:hypothetical protein
MAKRMVPRSPRRARGVEEENFGERYGNNYGYGREGQHVEDVGADNFGHNTRRNEYVDRYRRPTYTELDLPEQETFEGIGPKGYRRSDRRIEEDIYERLTRHGGLDARAIEIEIDDGDVILKGSVNNRQAKRIAEDVVYEVQGVRDVRNELRLR